MPRALIVFESMFGNGHRVADLVAAGLRDAGWEAQTMSVLDAPDVPDTDLLVLGAPTHALGLSRSATRAARSTHLATDDDQRKAAAEPRADTGRGMREYLGVLKLPGLMPVGVYDTRGGSRGPGGACRAMSRRVAAMGAQLLTPAQRFLVEGFTGPLASGEEERARQWGAKLAAMYPERVTSPV